MDKAHNIHIVVGRFVDIYIPNSWRQPIRDWLTIDNPFYFKLLRSQNPKMRRALWSVPKTFTYFKEDHEKIRVPRGVLDRLVAWLEKIPRKVDISIDYKLEGGLEGNFLRNSPNFAFRDYQNAAIEAIVGEKQGIIHMSTGSGKSIVALGVLQSLGRSGMIIVNRSSLMYQMADECEKFFGYRPGIVGDGKCEIKEVNVVMMQTLQRKPEVVKQLAEQSGVVIVDECHMAVTDRCVEVLQQFSPEHFYGMTATLQREDGKSKVINFLFGDILFEHQETMVTPDVHVIPTYAEIEMDEYHIMIENMVGNQGRNELIAMHAKQYMNDGYRVLILTKRKEHAASLFFLTMDWGEEVRLVRSEDKHRNKMLQECKKRPDTFQCLIGTTSLLSVGVDVPAIDAVFIACDMKGEALLQQSVGRGLRKWLAKDKAVVVDFWDGYVGEFGAAGRKRLVNPMLHRQFVKRKKIYESKGWKIEYKDPNMPTFLANK